MTYDNIPSSISYVRESVAAYATHSFEYIFAKRTLANLKYIDNEVEKRHKQGIPDKDIHDIFEVTQLINSFVGLLIIPKEVYYRDIKYSSSFESVQANELMDTLSKNKSKYQSSYSYKDSLGNYHPEQLNAKSLSRHFRNAVAHDHLTILPKDFSGNGSISGIVFEDTSSQDEYFRLELTIPEVRILLIALCNLMIGNI